MQLTAATKQAILKFLRSKSSSTTHIPIITVIETHLNKIELDSTAENWLALFRDLMQFRFDIYRKVPETRSDFADGLKAVQNYLWQQLRTKESALKVSLVTEKASAITNLERATTTAEAKKYQMTIAALGADFYLDRDQIQQDYPLAESFPALLYTNANHIKRWTNEELPALIANEKALISSENQKTFMSPPKISHTNKMDANALVSYTIPHTISIASPASINAQAKQLATIKSVTTAYLIECQQSSVYIDNALEIFDLFIRNPTLTACTDLFVFFMNSRVENELSMNANASLELDEQLHVLYSYLWEAFSSIMPRLPFNLVETQMDFTVRFGNSRLYSQPSTTEMQEYYQKATLLMERVRNSHEMPMETITQISTAQLESFKKLALDYLVSKKSAGAGANTKNENEQNKRDQYITKISDYFDALTKNQTANLWIDLFVYLQKLRIDLYYAPIKIFNVEKKVKKKDSAFGDALRVVHSFLFKTIDDISKQHDDNALKTILLYGENCLNEFKTLCAKKENWSEEELKQVENLRISAAALGNREILNRDSCLCNNKKNQTQLAVYPKNMYDLFSRDNRIADDQSEFFRLANAIMQLKFNVLSIENDNEEYGEIGEWDSDDDTAAVDIETNSKANSEAKTTGLKYFNDDSTRTTPVTTFEVETPTNARL